MMRSLLHLAVRAHDGLLSRWRNLWYRALGVRLTGYVWMRRVSIPDNWRNVTIEGGAGIDDGVVLRAGAGQRGEKLIIRTGTYINRYTIITAGERVEIGRNCLIGPHCRGWHRR